jgi:hypothetical protein
MNKLKPAKPDTGANRPGHFVPGKMPVGGFQAVWAFNDRSCQNSDVTKPEPQNRIIDSGK